MPGPISDEEKKRRGTFRADESKQARINRAAQKIITGVFLTKIPEPSFPLGPKGSVRRDEYDQITKMLFEQGKLTEVNVKWAEAAAITKGEIHAALEAGKNVSSKNIEAYKAILSKLDIAEKSHNIASPGKQNKFEGHGWSHKAGAPVRIIRAA